MLLDLKILKRSDYVFIPWLLIVLEVIALLFVLRILYLEIKDKKSVLFFDILDFIFAVCLVVFLFVIDVSGWMVWPAHNVLLISIWFVMVVRSVNRIWFSRARSEKSS